MKNPIKGRERSSVTKLSKELKISHTNTQRILKDDLRYFSCKKIIALFLDDAHKAERKKVANWIQSNFHSQQNMRVLLSNEKLFDINGLYNVQTDHVWTSTRAKVGESGGIKAKRKFPQKVMV